MLQHSVPSVTLCGKLLATVVGVSCIHFARLAAHDGNVTIVFVISLIFTGFRCTDAGWLRRSPVPTLRSDLELASYAFLLLCIVSKAVPWSGRRAYFWQGQCQSVWLFAGCLRP
jgi:hypothetical protein